MPRGLPKLEPVAWRDFEQLVSRIEQALVGTSVLVKSPDRIRSLLTKRLREVDASIRAQVGSSELLITVECRKRRAVQDVTWLEQLSSKKQALGAARTIAVSSSAFTEDAVFAARHYNIDLRVLSEITAADVQSWLLPQSVIHVFKWCDLLEPPEVSYRTEPGDSAASEANPAGYTSNLNSKVFVAPDGTELSLNDLWLRADEQLRIFDGVPTDDKVHRRRLAIRVGDTLRLRTPVGLRTVHEIKLSLALRWKHEEVHIAHARVVAYRPGDPSTQSPTYVRAEFTTKEASNMNLRLGWQVQSSSHTGNLSVEFLPGKAASDG